ncbi:dienelactone hydrolase family protein [Bradyrhizobium sp. MOS001]|uniref:dienelactone hydrolase family protein n=1 Tax=Bradyrhizobium sp. MOS001 TaxID=2133948 RepID=UPI001430E8E8|nr:dienelactone hydrolase family protein [Bradyrhizobium sp. MOS001]
MRFLTILLVLSFDAAQAEPAEVKITWNGDYAHNSSKHWSKDNPYDSGFSKNFKNGTPQEFGDVQKDGELNAFIYSPKEAKGPVPFVIVMHGCDGMSTTEKEWTARVANAINKEGFGALVLDSYTTRYVDNSCGLSDLHWGRRRSDDAYSALDYLIEKKLTKFNEVYIMGYSNGGTTALVSMTTQESDHPHRFAAAFAIAPGCSPSLQHSALYTGPVLIFMGDKDDANNPEWCRELTKKKRSVPVQMIEYQGANHGFVLDVPSHLGDHGWALTYNPVAEKDMMQTIISAIKAKKIKSGIEVRTAQGAALK